MLRVSDQKLPNFQAKMQASACYLEIEGRILLVQQATGRRDAGLWGVPAGKLETDETPEIAAKRELFEETGIRIHSPNQIQFIKTLYIRKLDLDYTYYMFKILLDTKPSIQLALEEHAQYLWASFEEIKKLPLRDGAIEALEHYKSSII